MKRVKPSELGSVLKGLSELAGDDFLVILQKLSLDGFRELVRRSAKDSGFLRSNWDISTIPPSEERLKNTGVEKYGPPSDPYISTIKIDDTVTLFNNTEYANYLEIGTPRMRAQPMVEPTRRSLEKQAILLSKALTKKKYNV